MADLEKRRFVLVVEGDGHAAAALLEDAGFSVIELRFPSRIMPDPLSEEEDLGESGDTSE